METQKDMTFEQALEELETLVARMENGKLPLAELISGFEKGNRLTAFCRRELDSLERRIEVLTRDDGGAGDWSEFHPESDRSAPPPPPPQAAPPVPQDPDEDPDRLF